MLEVRENSYLPVYYIHREVDEISTTSSLLLLRVSSVCLDAIPLVSIHALSTLTEIAAFQ